MHYQPTNQPTNQLTNQAAYGLTVSYKVAYTRLKTKKKTMVSAAWDDVKPGNVKNCHTKAGSVPLPNLSLFF